MTAMPVIDRLDAEQGVHISVTPSKSIALCYKSLRNPVGEFRFVAAPDKVVTCEKCKKACRELITILQACIPDEPDYSSPQYDI